MRNGALGRRGDLTLWLDKAAPAGWRAPRRSTSGGQPICFNLAIGLLLALPFHPALRQPAAFAARFTQERIIGVIKKHQAGATAADLRRKHEISDATFYT